MSKIQINFDDLQGFATQLGKAANKCDEALGHINVDLYSLLANIPGVASKNIHELETIFESNLKKYKKNLLKAQHLMRITEAIISETERKLARKAREIVEEHARIFSTLQMVDNHVWVPQINGMDEHDSSTKLTDEQVEGLRNYIRRLKNGEIDSNLDDYRAMPEDNTWQGNIFPSNPGERPEVDPVTKALGKFAFDFLLGDIVTILDPEALTEDKLIAAAMMLPPAKVFKLVDKLKDMEKMKDTIDTLDDVSDKVKDTSDNLQDASKGEGKSVKTGVAKSRINISNSGWKHVVDRHFSSKNASQFTISQNELKSILQSKDIVKSPIIRTIDSADGIRYVREINLGKNIGIDKFNNFQPTSKMTILTDFRKKSPILKECEGR